MIIARAPLRISLAGGGTDLPWYAAEHGARLLTMTIDRYVTVMLKKREWDEKIRVAYKKDELVDNAADLEHPLLRHALAGFYGIELHTMADVPANTGLGSSGAFMVALSAALGTMQGYRDDARTLAKHAHKYEKDVDPDTGWQDHMIAAFGGIQSFDGGAWPDRVNQFRISEGQIKGIETLELWFTGTHRSAQDVLRAQAKEANVEAMHQIKKLVGLVSAGEHIGSILDRHHALKLATAPDVMSNPRIEGAIAVAKRCGAIGAKIVGAGGGGFLLVSAPADCRDDRSTLRQRLTEFGFKRQDVRFGVPGVEVIRW
jgi:D-glycero-alpha-D-manno-heptose-7-phosphate kinase